MKTLNYNNLIILKKFLYNQVNFDYFKKLFEKAFGPQDDFYLMEKFELFQRCQIDAVLKFEEKFLNIILDEIEKTGYKG